MNSMEWIQWWYSDHCDGDWEHQSGVSIYTVDNPGWRLVVELADTELEEKPFSEVTIERTPTDWITCFVRERKFEGAGGQGNLLEMIEIFRAWAALEPK